MDIFIIVLLIVGAVILLLVELFFIPGISIAGIGALGCLIYATYYAFVNLGTAAGFITLAISVAACAVSITLFMRSKTLDKISLKKNITSKVDRHAEESIKVGDTGVTTTRLALIGHALINDKNVEVKSIDGFLDEKTPIVVERITNGTILVNKQK
ncbi:nodulation efficiency protein D (NfeD) [Bacteroides sp. OttesenSCG-928-J23]|nr:nodulation efficiency protein D (NfeD) [Bacteroides sp. OttesenSCG-928-N06]MDL2247778.1 nodulation efficiency protein D (NfeD) [Bacteroides sp. OttesenSCG-928-J23]